MKVNIDFSGGLETLFGGKKRLNLDIDVEGKQFTVHDLIMYLKEHEMDKSKEDMFLQDETVRPGILVLINDADWELEGEENYEIQPNDNIMFASTLHGG